jgi:UDP-N-acetylmuramoyl-L-alanyl-D-glutamate--2,6-diaminopimelate ligase
MLLEDKDVLLIAGKGHETYQEIKGVKTQFDDRQVVQEILLKLF